MVFTYTNHHTYPFCAIELLMVVFNSDLHQIMKIALLSSILLVVLYQQANCLEYSDTALTFDLELIKHQSCSYIRG